MQIFFLIKNNLPTQYYDYECLHDIKCISKHIEGEAFSKHIFSPFFSQVQVSGNTFSNVLKNLQSDTEYAVTVVPVYVIGEGKRMTENGKTRESSFKSKHA